MTKAEMLKKYKKMTGVGRVKFDLHNLVTWSKNAGEASNFGYGVQWGLGTQRFNNNAESAMLAMTSAKLVELLVDVIMNANGDGQQGVVNYINRRYAR